jgi:hypothetical protein
MTRAYNTATTQQNSGGVVAGVTAGKNFVINGGFDFWQRGTSSTSSGVFLADRWIHGRAGGASGGTYTRQTATDSSTLPFLQYSFRLQRDSGNTGTAQLNLNQVIETANSVPLAGKTITLSFYARVGANFSATSGTAIAYLFTGTGTDQNGVLGAWTGSANPLSASFTGATTTWQRFQATATLSSTTNEIYFGIGFTPTGTAGAADWLEIAGVQLEVGSVATPFSRSTGTYATELAACQRYYYVHSRNENWANGQASSTSGVTAPILLPIEMRVAPTITLATAGASSGNINFLSSSLNFPSTTGTISASSITKNGFQIVGSGFTSSFTAGNSSLVYSNGTSNVYTASSEL